MSSTGIAYYNAARSEINERIKLRDQIILSFIVSSGAVIGLAIGDVGGKGETISLIIPYLALGTSVLVATHNMAISRLGSYFQELAPAINQCRVEGFVEPFDKFIEILPWDTSETYRKHGKHSSRYRMYAQLIIFFMPSLFALGVGWEKIQFPFTFPTDIHSLLWVWGFIATVASCIYLIYIHINRKNIIEQMRS